MNLEETKNHIETEIELPFPWKLEHIERGDYAITAADNAYLDHETLWLYIQALEREVERLQKAATVLSALEDFGVDNWTGYDLAMEKLAND